MKINNFCIFLLLLIQTNLFSQENFQFYRNVSPAANGWNAIELNDSVISVLHKNLYGIRLFQLNEKDTTEIPFLLRMENEKWVENMVYSEILNKGFTKEGFEYMIDQKENNITNFLSIFLRNKDFDYKVKLQGSNDLKNWTTIGDNFRIVDIQIDQNSFRSNSILFSPCNFRYFKVLIIDAKKDIDLYKTTLKIKEIKEGNYQIISPTFTSQYNKENKKSTHLVEFASPIAVSSFEPKINYNGDYLRNAKLYVLKDSIKTKNGNKANWQFIASYQLSSLNINYIPFSSQITNALKIEIEEMDNPPLLMDSILIKKPNVLLVAQLNKDNAYALFYGNEKIGKPNYDLENFASSIPDTLEKAKMMHENAFFVTKKNALLENNIWLWLILGLIILVLGIFTIKMVKKV